MSTPCRYLIPARHSAWLTGELGKHLTASIVEALPGATASRLTRAVLVEGLTASDLPRILAAIDASETTTATKYPIFHHEMGPVWTGAVQAVKDVNE